MLYKEDEAQCLMVERLIGIELKKQKDGRGQEDKEYG